VRLIARRPQSSFPCSRRAGPAGLAGRLDLLLDRLRSPPADTSPSFAAASWNSSIFFVKSSMFFQISALRGYRLAGTLGKAAHQFSVASVARSLRSRHARVVPRNLAFQRHLHWPEIWRSGSSSTRDTRSRILVSDAAATEAVAAKAHAAIARKKALFFILSSGGSFTSVCSLFPTRRAYREIAPW